MPVVTDACPEPVLATESQELKARPCLGGLRGCLGGQGKGRGSTVQDEHTLRLCILGTGSVARAGPCWAQEDGGSLSGRTKWREVAHLR